MISSGMYRVQVQLSQSMVIASTMLFRGMRLCTLLIASSVPDFPRGRDKYRNCFD